MGNHRTPPLLWEHDEKLFENEQDLVALAPVDTDRLNYLLRTYCGWLFKVSDFRESLGVCFAEDVYVD